MATSNWLNGDGLYIKFGTNEAEVGKAGQYVTFGPLQEVEVVVDLAKLSTSAQTILDDNTIVGKYRIEDVIVEVETAATSGGSATLDVGFVKTDRTSELDYDGLVAAAALTSINAAGKKLTLITGATGAGALIGTTLSSPGLFVAKAGTTTFNDGRVKVRVRYYKVIP